MKERRSNKQSSTHTHTQQTLYTADTHTDECSFFLFFCPAVYVPIAGAVLGCVCVQRRKCVLGINMRPGSQSLAI
jgi:hypothetical protein